MGDSMVIGISVSLFYCRGVVVSIDGGGGGGGGAAAADDDDDDELKANCIHYDDVDHQKMLL